MSHSYINPLTYLEDKDSEICRLAVEGEAVLTEMEAVVDDPKRGLDHPDYDRLLAKYEAKKTDIGYRLVMLGRKF